MTFATHDVEECTSELTQKSHKVFNRTPVRGYPDCIAWSPDGLRLAIGFRNGAVLGINISKEPMVSKILVEEVKEPKRGGVYVVKWSPDGARLFYGDYWQQECAIIDVSGTKALEIGGSAAPVAGDWCPDGTKVAVGYGDGTVKIIDSKDGAVISMIGQKCKVADVAWTDDCAHLAIAYKSQKNLEVVDTQSWQVVFETSAPLEAFSVQWAPTVSSMPITCQHSLEDNNIACLTSFGGVHVGTFAIPAGEQPFGDWLLNQVLSTSACFKKNVTLVSPGGEIYASSTSPARAHAMLAIGGWAGESWDEAFFHARISIIDFTSKESIATADGKGGVKDLQWSIDGSKVLALGFHPMESKWRDPRCGMDSLSIIDAASGAILHYIEADGRDHGMTLSPDGTMVASVVPLRIINVGSFLGMDPCVDPGSEDGRRLSNAPGLQMSKQFQGAKKIDDGWVLDSPIVVGSHISYVGGGRFRGDQTCPNGLTLSVGDKGVVHAMPGANAELGCTFEKLSRRLRVSLDLADVRPDVGGEGDNSRKGRPSMTKSRPSMRTSSGYPSSRGGRGRGRGKGYPSS